MTYVTDAIARLRSVYKGTDVEDLIQVIFERLDDLNTASEWIRTNYTLANAPGVWLDMLGQVVGYERPKATHPYCQMFAFKAGTEQADYIDDPYKAFLEVTEAYGSELVTNGTFASDLTGWDDNSILPGTAVWDTGTAKMSAGSGITELVTNGTFDSDLSSWTTGTTGTAAVSWSGGKMRITSGDSGTAYAYQDITTVVGSTYTVEIDTVTETGAPDLHLKILSSGSVVLLDEDISTVDSYSFSFEAITTTTKVRVEFSGAESISEVDNISCYRIIPPNAGILDQEVTVQEGALYEFKFDVKTGSDTSATGETYVRVGTVEGQKDLYGYTVDAIGVQTTRFTANGTSAFVRLYCENDGAYLKIDDVSMKKVTRTTGTIGGYMQSIKGLPHLVDPTVEMSDTLYRDRVEAKANANNVNGLLSEIFTFFKDCYGIDEPVVSEGLYWAGITLYGKDLASQQSRYLFNLYGPHSALVTLIVLNWTFEYRAFTQYFVGAHANWEIDEDTIRGDWFGLTDFPDVLVDGDMENSGVGDWLVGNGATLSKQTSNPQAGLQVIRVYRSGTYGSAYQDVMTAGKVYRFTGFGRSGGDSGVPYLYNEATQQWIGTTSTAWQSIDTTFKAAGNSILLQKGGFGETAEFDSCSLLDLSEPCKVLTCNSGVDLCYLPVPGYWNITTAQAAYGTWTSYIYYPTGTQPIFVIVGTVADTINHASQNGYALYVSSGGQLRLAKITAGVTASLFTSTNGYISNNNWHKFVVTRSATGEFSVYADEVLVPADYGSNPVTDTTYTSSNYQTLEMSTGNKIGLCTMEDDILQNYEPL